MADATLLDVINRFDGAAIWPTLTSEQQADIGAAALNLAMSWRCEDDALDCIPAFGRVADKAAGDCMDNLINAFDAAVVEGLTETPSGQLRIPTTLGMICEACGCTEDDACEGGCAWARDNRCTSCIESAPETAHG
jgi:hypothetical protein